MTSINPLHQWDDARRCIAIGQYEQARSYLTEVILDPALPGTLVPLVQSDLHYVEQFLRQGAWHRLAQWLQGIERFNNKKAGAGETDSGQLSTPEGAATSTEQCTPALGGEDRDRRGA